ncbi:MAG: hypothetical protein JO227_22690 [Acetobacteraceae bacterium]|nr:hypothetical protein [Acetobacteraceae bacterium]
MLTKITTPARCATLFSCGLATALLQGCAERPAPVQHARVFAADMTGAAKTCTVSKVETKDGEETAATMQVASNGGWCAITITRNGKPFDAGLLVTRPEHGTVFIHPVGDDTRIDYTPVRGYAGPDLFTVKLIPGDPAIRTLVTVVAG